MAAPTIGEVSSAVSSAAGTVIDYSYPATVNAGEIIFLWMKVQNYQFLDFLTDADGWTLPTDWQHTFLGHGGAILGWREADGTEGGTSGAMTIAGATSSALAETFTIRGHDATAWLDAHQRTNNGATASQTFNLAGVTTTGPERLILFFATTNDAVNNDWQTLGVTDNLDTNELFDQVSGTNRHISTSWEQQEAEGATGTRQVSWQSGGVAVNGKNWGNVIAIAPPPEPLIETMRPSAVTLDQGFTGGNAAAIDQDPDDVVITDAGLTAPDPSGTTGLTDGPEFVDGPASATPWSGATGISFGTYANLIDASDATSTATTLAATNTDYQNFLSFAAGDWTSLPAGAIPTAIDVIIRHSVGTNNRLQTHLALATVNGTLLGSEVNTANNTPGSTTAQAVITNAEQTVNAFGAVPTRAQLVTGTFGVRLRGRRSNTVAWTIFSIKATVTYRLPGSSTTTQATITLPAPTLGSLEPGAATGEIRARIRGRGTPDTAGQNPTGRLEVRNAAGTLLGTAISDTAASDSSAGGAIVSGTFDQAIISDPTSVRLRFVGTPVLGRLAELVAVEWNGRIVEVAGVELAGRADFSGQVSGALTVEKSLSGRTDLIGSASGILSVTKEAIGRADLAGQHSGVLSVTKQLAGRADLLGQHSGVLSVSKELAGRADLAGFIAGTLAVEKLLSGRSDFSGSIAGILAITKEAAGRADFLGQHSGSLLVTRELAGRADFLGQHSGVLSITKLLAGSAILNAFIQGEPVRPIVLTASAIFGGQVLGNLEVTKLLSASGILAGQHSGALAVTKELQGRADFAGAHSGILSITKQLAGRADLAGFVAGALAVEKLLSSRADFAGVHSGALAVSKLLAGRADLAGSISGALAITKLLSGRSDFLGNVRGTLAVADAGAVLLAGSAILSAAISGNLEVSKALSGSAVLLGQNQGVLEVSKLLSGDARFVGQHSGLLAVTKLLAASSIVSGQHSGILSVTKLLAGRSDLASVVQATLTVEKLLAGRVDLAGLVSGALNVEKALAAEAILEGVHSGNVEVTRLLAGLILFESFVYGELSKKAVWENTVLAGGSVGSGGAVARAGAASSRASVSGAGSGGPGRP